MKEWILICLAACLIPLQAIVNGRLGQLLMNPFLAALISFAGGIVILTAMCLIQAGGIPSFPSGVKIPWYLLTGGIFGSIFVTLVLMFVHRIGATNVMTAAIVGQLFTGLMLDHYGLLGIPLNRISVLRICGVCLLVFGTFMINADKPIIQAWTRMTSHESSIPQQDE